MKKENLEVEVSKPKAWGISIGLIIGILIAFLLVINLASAAEWDNVKSYDKETKTVQVENIFGLGAVIGEAQLITPTSVRGLFPGYQNVSMIKVTGNSDYLDFIKNIRSYSLDKTKEDTTRTYDIRYLTIELVDVKDWSCSDQLVNGSYYNICEELLTTHQENKSVWRDLSEIKINKDQELIIGLFTDVKEGDLVEWVPTIFGVEVDEWADFGAATRREYFTDGATSANTFNGPSWWEGQSFTIGNVGANQTFNLTGIITDIEGSTDAVIFVYNTSGGVPTGTPISTGNTGTLGARGYYNTSMASTELLIAGKKYVYLIYNPTSMKQYENTTSPLYSGGIEIECSANGTSCSETAGRDAWFEVWGTTSNTPATATLNQPANGSTVTNSLVVFNITGSDDTTLQNLSLIVNGTYISTNSSPINNTLTRFSYTLPAVGFYNWSAEACDNTDSCTNTSIFYITLTNNVGITLNEPINSSTVFSPNVLFNMTGSDDTALQNMSLIVNGSYISTNSSPINNTKTGFSYTLPTRGLYNWSGESCDNTDTCANASAFYLWYNTSIAVALNQPANAYLSSSSSILFNATASDDTIVQNISFILNGTYNGTNTSVFNNTLTQFLKNIPDGFWNWSAEACDNLGTCVNATSRNFTVDTTAPAVASNSSTIYTFQAINTVLPLYYTISDTNLAQCYIQWYNGTNSTITCATSSLVVNTTGFYTPRNLTYWANDTVGHYNSLFINWSYKLFLENETYVPHVLEGSSNNFTLGVLTNGSTITIANLSYNNGENFGALSSGTNYTIYEPIIAPSVSADTNYTFFWNITFGDGTYYALSSHQQNVTGLAVDNCSAYSNVIYNFTLKDEETQTELNESAINSLGGYLNLQIYSYGTDDEVLNFSRLYNQTNPFAVCLSSALGGGQQYNIYSQVQYFADTYSTELYHIQNATLNSTYLPQNITLYDLLTSNSQVFEIIFKSSAYLPVEDALIQIERKYISEGLFKIVEIPKTDENGETVAHLQLNNVIYNLIVKKYGETLATFSNVIPVCQTPTISDCVIDLNAFSTTVEVPDYTTDGDLNFTLGYNSSTRVVSSVFVIPSGTPATILLNVSRQDALGTSVCTNTVTSTSGTVSCTVPTSFGNSTILAQIYRDGELVSQGTIKLDQDSSDIYGGILIVLGLFIMITLVGVGISDNPMTTLIFLAIGGILIFGMNLVVNNGFVGATATILWLLMAILIVMVKGGRRN